MFGKKTALASAVLAGIMALQISSVVQANTTSAEKAVFKAPKLAMKIDRRDLDQLPRNYRRGDAQFKEDAATRVRTGVIPSRKGMDMAMYSASSCMSEKEFQKVLQASDVTPDKFYDIDLRGESHGYLDGICVSWFSDNDWGNDGREQFIIESIEKDQLNSVKKNTPIDVYTFNDDTNKVEPPVKIIVSKVRTEEQMVRDNGAKYFRLALMDHFRPDDSDVDRFLHFWKQLPKGSWMHYHCFAGVGRTTIFATMHDIIKSNDTGVSFDDIIARQALIGPTNLAAWSTKSNWKRKSYKERYIFVRQFYDYVKEHPTFDIPYSQWTKEHNYDSLDDDFSGYIWRVDKSDKSGMPNNFRSSQSKMNMDVSEKALKSSGVEAWLSDGHKISEKGLRTLKMSGSAQFSVQQAKTLFDELKCLTDGPVYDVDLREETHGFMNGNAISWYGERDWGNRGKKHSEIVVDEKDAISRLAGKNILTSELGKKKLPENPSYALARMTMTEQELVEGLGVKYFRITATDHLFPSAENVDRFIAFFKSLPKNAWLHYHCQAGEGRTTAFMVMQDMMTNPDVPMYDILLRQNMIGGNFAAFTSKGNQKGEWKADYYNHKAKYIKMFYSYCKQQAKNNFAMSWSDWLKINDTVR